MLSQPNLPKLLAAVAALLLLMLVTGSAKRAPVAQEPRASYIDGVRAHLQKEIRTTRDELGSFRGQLRNSAATVRGGFEGQREGGRNADVQRKPAFPERTPVAKAVTRPGSPPVVAAPPLPLVAPLPPAPAAPAMPVFPAAQQQEVRTVAGIVVQSAPPNAAPAAPAADPAASPLPLRYSVASSLSHLARVGMGTVAVGPNETPPALKGQATPGTRWYAALTRLALDDRVRTFLELGTWYGGGTTFAIASSMRDAGAILMDGAGNTPTKLLVSVDVARAPLEYARKSLHGRNLPVRFVLGCTLRLNQIPSEEELAADPQSALFGSHEWVRWLAETRQACAQRLSTGPVRSDVDASGTHDVPQPVLEGLCGKYRFDAVLIDSSSVTGAAEWGIVRDLCRPRFVLLHDTGSYQTAQALLDLKGNAEHWELLDKGGPPEETAGWAIYRDKTAP